MCMPITSCGATPLARIVKEDEIAPLLADFEKYLAFARQTKNMIQPTLQVEKLFEFKFQPVQVRRRLRSFSVKASAGRTSNYPLRPGDVALHRIEDAVILSP